MSDLIESSTNTVMGLLIFVIMVCVALIPISIDMINNLIAKYATSAFASDVEQYTSLLGVAIVFVILGVIVGIIRTYSRSERD